jgi:hypothetical protein
MKTSPPTESATTHDRERLTTQLVALYDAVTAWRDAKCLITRPHVAGEEVCEGDNHLENCPVELARQDVIDAHNKVIGPVVASGG